MVLYKEFKVGDLFRLKSIRQIPRGFVPELKEDGEYPYLTQKTGGSYGVNGYIDETDELELIEEPMIITGVDNVANGVMYWWDKPFYANKMLGLLNENLNRERAQYIISVLLKMYMGFDYNNKINMKIVRETVIQLPVKSLEDTEPDWEYMEEYIKQKELAYIGNLNKEFKQKKEQLIELIGEESEYINIEDLPTAKFKVEDIYKNVYRGKRITKKDRVQGLYPLVTAGKERYGISEYIEGHTTKGNRNTITIDMFGNVFYRDYPYFMDDNIIVLENEDLRKEHNLYIASVIGYLKDEYSYAKQFRMKSLENTTLELPINPEVSDIVPDWNTMEDYVNGIKHLYKLKEEESHKEKLELLYELTGWTEQDLDNIENLGGINRV